MYSSKFFQMFEGASSTPAIKNELLQHSDIEHILSHAQSGSLVVLDIDDTIGRVPQAIGLDSWFRMRLQQHAADGHAPSQALLLTIEIYNLAQLASTEMVPVDKSKNVADIIEQLKKNQVTVIGLTARNHILTDKTLSLLDTLGVSFSSGVLNDATFTLNDKLVEIKNGVIFANGNDKGHCFEYVVSQGYLLRDIGSFHSIDFVDDSERNCHAVHAAFERMNITMSRVWHYPYAELHLTFTAVDQKRADIQELHLLEKQVLLTDEEADQLLSAPCSSF
ncbi:DUF2608 domain-containing protein [Legionella sp. km535]|uniref:DUF2608 domain-containing protein n=1 Tax=Legionella sp. km535 TaxID=2498107 RepID=UPI0013150631|nr:DUF2608 domain-containing protein [Legionella sp. km535]